MGIVMVAMTGGREAGRRRTVRGARAFSQYLALSPRCRPPALSSLLPHLLSKFFNLVRSFTNLDVFRDRDRFV